MKTQEALNELWDALVDHDEEEGGDGLPLDLFHEEVEKGGGDFLTQPGPQEDPFDGFIECMEAHGCTVLEDPSGSEFGGWVVFWPGAHPTDEDGSADTEALRHGKLRPIHDATCALIDEGASIDETITGLYTMIGLLRKRKEAQAKEEEITDNEDGNEERHILPMTVGVRSREERSGRT